MVVRGSQGSPASEMAQQRPYGPAGPERLWAWRSAAPECSQWLEHGTMVRTLRELAGLLFKYFLQQMRPNKGHQYVVVNLQTKKAWLKKSELNCNTSYTTQLDISTTTPL